MRWRSYLAVLVVFALPSLANARAQDNAPMAGKLWEARYNGTGYSFDDANAVGVSPDGATVFVTGGSAGPMGDFDYATVAYDTTTGAQAWVARYDGPANTSDVALALGVSPDGTTVYVTGESNGSGSDLDYATVAYDAATGSQLWVARYNGPGNGEDAATALGVSPDGVTVFVTGRSFGVGTSEDYATVAYDAATGTELWVARYDGPTSQSDDANALGVSPDGATVFVTGSSPGSGSLAFHYATVAYDAATGTQRWVARYIGPADRVDQAYALGVSPDGRTVFVTGSSTGSGTGFDDATVAYDAGTGTQRWVARYNGPANDTDAASALAVSPDGTTVYVTGESYGSVSGADYATVAYGAATGTQRWVARYNGPANGFDAATAMGVTPDASTVFVTGYSSRVNFGSDYATVRYDSVTGHVQGVARTGRGTAEALALTPDGGALLVTGSAGASSTDYGTVAYSLLR